MKMSGNLMVVCLSRAFLEEGFAKLVTPEPTLADLRALYEFSLHAERAYRIVKANTSFTDWLRDEDAETDAIFGELSRKVQDIFVKYLFGEMATNRERVEAMVMYTEMFGPNLPE